MSEPLRVAVVAGAYTDVLDGVTLTTDRQVRYLLDRGVPVRVYAPGPVRPVHAPAGELVPVPSVPLTGTAYRMAVGLTPAVRRDLRRFRPTLVHLATPDLLGAGVLRWAVRRRVPAVATFHTHFARYLRYYRLGLLEPLAWRWLRGFYRRCREVYVAARSTADELAEHGIAGNVAIRPFGVDADHFAPARRSDDWRSRHGIGPGDVAVLFVGRLVWEKGLRVWADAVRRLEADRVPHRGVVVGEGPAGPAVRAMLPRTTFTGRLSGDELATAYASSDVFLFPSGSETFGLVTVEALASGLAVVVADAPGSRDIVRDGVDGMVCPAGDAAAFAAAVARLVREPAMRAAFAAAGVRRAAAYRWDAVLGQMLSDFRHVLQAG